VNITPKLYVYAIVLISFFAACRKEDDFTSDASAKLSFSLDTVTFDTVFTQFGQNRPLSITKQLWVVNNNAKGVKVSIRIAGNQYGLYKINIDGQATTAVTQKEIRGRDSIVIFVQVYLNQVNTNTPFIVIDQLVFETSGNSQRVELVAYPQDAVYLNNAVLTCTAGNLHWTADKPYVIYDSILVPKGCVLTIDAGTKIHSHNASAILVAGTLIVNGTINNPVIFESDRLDGEYRNRSGQWGSIHLLSSSIDNVVNHAIIKNGIIGIRVDSLSNNQNPKLLLRNSTIKNMSAVGLLGFTATLTAINNEVLNCGQFTFYARYGGNYNVYHNTFASYGINFNRQNAQFLVDNSPLENEQGQATAVFDLDMVMINNIVYGSEEEELILNNNPQGGAFNVQLQNNLLRTQIAALNINQNILNIDPQFEDIAAENMRLKALSPAKNKGLSVNIFTDLLEAPRNQTTPSIGAYE
jgi:hypothetical protein